MNTPYVRPTPTKEQLEGCRLLERNEVFKDGDWYGAGFDFKFVIGTNATGIKAGDPVDGPAFGYNPCRPIK